MCADGGVQDDEQDYDFPVWAGLLKTKLIVDGVVDDEHLCDGIERPEALANLTPGSPLEEYVRHNIKLLEKA